MTRKDLNELPGIPRWLGQPMYPGGIPLPKENITFEDKNVQEMYFQRCDDISNNKEPNKDDEMMLKSYVFYHVFAPVFDSEFSDELRESLHEEMSLDDIIMQCMEYGLDPL